MAPYQVLTSADRAVVAFDVTSGDSETSSGFCEVRTRCTEPLAQP